MSRLAAKASFLKINGTRIEVTKISPSAPRGLATTTDSSNYDPTSDLIWQSQIAVTGKLELAVEGLIYTESTGTTFLTWLFTSQVAQPCIIYYAPLLIFGHGNFDLTNFKVDLNITEEEPIKYSIDLVSNGVFTPNA